LAQFFAISLCLYKWLDFDGVLLVEHAVHGRLLDVPAAALEEEALGRFGQVLGVKVPEIGTLCYVFAKAKVWKPCALGTKVPRCMQSVIVPAQSPR
jgi:hypothetical protein